MLEARIEELTAAVVALTKAIGRMQAPAPLSAVIPAEVLKAFEEMKPKKEVPNVSPTTTATSQTSVEESKPVSYSDVSKLVTEIAKKDLAKAKAALARLGVKHGKELTEAQWPEAIAYLTRVAAGEVDPEASHA